MRGIGLALLVPLAIASAILILKFGTVSPCGILRYEIRQEAIRQGGMGAAIGSLLPDAAVDAIIATQYGQLTTGRCLSILIGQPPTKNGQGSATSMPKPEAVTGVAKPLRQPTTPLPQAVDDTLKRLYPFSIPIINPEAFVAWRRIIPAPFRYQDWIFELKATASPYTTVKLRGVRYLYGSFCKPHDCGANSVAFLMAEDGSSAAGLYAVGIEPNSREIWFGNPDSDEMLLLRARAHY